MWKTKKRKVNHRRRSYTSADILKVAVLLAANVLLVILLIVLCATGAYVIRLFLQGAS